MIALEIQTGEPQVDGRYVAFIRCEASQAAAWVEPAIMTWHNARWHSTFMPQRNVLGWIGPLPVLKAEDLLRFPGLVVEPLEFDL